MKLKLCFAACVVAAATFAGSAGAASTGYTITDLGVLPGRGDSTAYAINAAGQVVGVSGNRAFLWQHGTMIDLGTLNGSAYSWAYGLNDNGEIVGASGPTSSEEHAMLVRVDAAGNVLSRTDLGGWPWGSRWTEAHAINDAGTIVGDGGDYEVIRGTIWSAGGGVSGVDENACWPCNTVFTDVNSSGRISGFYPAFSVTQFTGTTASTQPKTVIPGLGGSSGGLAINDAGQVTGWYSVSGYQHAFRWTPGAPAVDLGVLPGWHWSKGEGIDAAGDVVGSAEAPGGSHAFLYAAGGMTDLNTLLPSGSGWVLVEATAINDGGRIVGWGYHNGARRAFLLSPPAPDTTPPAIVCGTADGAWHADNVSIACTATDSGSGLANPADASFTLTTDVPAGTETADAQTGTRNVCDVAGNCATAGPIGGNEIDRRPPSIAIATPDATPYLLGASVTPAYTCSDGGSGVATCAGGSVDTSSVGTKRFAVSATDNVGNAASTSVGYTVTYGVTSLFDTAKPFGGRARVELALADANGADVSSASVELDAVTLDGAPFTGTFEYRPQLGGYLLAFGTKGLSAGTHTLAFTAAGDPVTHEVTFTTR